MGRAFSNVGFYVKVHSHSTRCTSTAHSLCMALDLQNSSATDQSLSLAHEQLVHDDDEELDVVSTSEEAFVSKLPDNGTKTVCRSLTLSLLPSAHCAARSTHRTSDAQPVNSGLQALVQGDQGCLLGALPLSPTASHCPSLGCRLPCFSLP